MAATTNPRRQYEEYLTLEYLLLGDFRSALEDAEDEAGHNWLVAVMDALLDALPRKPGLTRAAAAVGSSAVKDLDELCAEQDTLCGAFRDHRASATHAAAFLADRRQQVERLIEWLRRLNEHNQRLNAIVRSGFGTTDAPAP